MRERGTQEKLLLVVLGLVMGRLRFLQVVPSQQVLDLSGSHADGGRGKTT